MTAGKRSSGHALGAFLLSAILLGASGAAAQLAPIGEGVGEGPIDITGDTLEVIDDIATWTGRVSAIQGEAILTADKLVATLVDGDISEIAASGAVRYSNGQEAITGRTALYDATARTITITDDVVVTQGEQIMTGGKLVYWIDTGRLRFAPPAGQRVRGVFHTKSNGDQS